MDSGWVDAMIFALCLVFIILAFGGPFPSELGHRSKTVIAHAVAWAIVMLATAFALLVLAKGWPS